MHPTLIAAFEKAPPDHPVGTIHRAFELESEAKTSPSAADVILRAGRLVGARPVAQGGRTDDDRRGGRLKVSDTSRMRAQRVMTDLTPSVECARRACFGQTEPPFATRVDAVEWLKQTAEREWQRYEERWPSVYVNAPADAASRSETVQRTDNPPWQTAAEQARVDQARASLTAAMWPITGGSPAYLEYLTSTGRTDRVRVPGLGFDDKQRAITRDLVLPRFRQDVNSLRFASGFDESSVVDWILTGSPPTLRPALLKHESFPVTVPGDTTYTSERVIITIQAPHVTEREFRQLYALTRRAWRQARRTHLTGADVRLLETIRRQGPPTRPKAEPGYWGQIARASRLKSAEAARVRWSRLEARHPELTRQTAHPG